MQSSKQIRDMQLKNRGGMLVFTIFLLFLFFAARTSWAQEKEEMDISKPTNLYTQYQNTLEYGFNDDNSLGKTIGYRGIFNLASADQNHLVGIEVPMLYNTQSGKFGVGDMRVRYFGIVYKDYSKLFGAFAPSIDLFIPTGSFDNGLGSSSWRISPGVAGGLIFSPSFQTFPILSYLLTTKPGTDKIPEDQKKTRHGLTLQSITVINFESWFLWLTPIYVIPDLGDSSIKNQFILEVRPSTRAINGKFQLAVFYRRNFEAKANTVRAIINLFL